jgi:hypothetical protein
MCRRSAVIFFLLELTGAVGPGMSDELQLVPDAHYMRRLPGSWSLLYIRPRRPQLRKSEDYSIVG